jgi:FixJ family two-component response regulator
LVFIVENDDAVRDSLGMVLQIADIPYQAFDSLEHFLKAYDRVTAGCFVLDINLPKTNDYNLEASLIQQIQLPIILLVNFGDMPMSIRESNLEIFAVLTKPVRVDLLIDTIQALLQQKLKTRS